MTASTDFAFVVVWSFILQSGKFNCQLSEWRPSCSFKYFVSFDAAWEASGTQQNTRPESWAQGSSAASNFKVPSCNNFTSFGSPICNLDNIFFSARPSLGVRQSLNGKWGGWIPTQQASRLEDTFLWLGSFHILQQMGPLAASVKHTFYKADFRCWCTAEKHPCFNACGAITWDLWSHFFGSNFCVRPPNLVIKPKNLNLTPLSGGTFFNNSSSACKVCLGQWEVSWKSYRLLSACFPEKNNASAQKQGSSWPPEGMKFNHVMCKANPRHSSWPQVDTYFERVTWKRFKLST